MQKRTKGNNLRFQLLPLQNSSNQSKSDQSDHSDDKGPLWLGVFLVVIITAKYLLLRKYYFSKDSEPSAKSDFEKVKVSDNELLSED